MADKKQNEVTMAETRESLITIFQGEVEPLPELLHQLDIKERINVIMKMMPYIVPPVKSVHYEAGKPSKWQTEFGSLL